MAQAKEKDAPKQVSYSYLKDLLDTIADPVFVKDRAHRWIDGNKAFWELMGGPPENFLGRSDYDFFPKAEADVFWQTDNRVFTTGQTDINEEFLTDHQGKRHVISTKKAVFRNEAGEPVLVGVIRDITAEKQLEELEKQQANEKRLRAIADAVPALLWVSDSDKLMIFFNQSWLEFTGNGMERELGAGWMDNVHPQDIERFLSVYLQKFDRREPFEIEFRMRRSDGVYRWILDRGVPRYDEEGRFEGYIGACIDIQLRFETEQALEEREARLHNIIENAADGLITVSPQGIIESFNPACERIFGYRAAAIIGTEISRLLPSASGIAFDLYARRRQEGQASASADGGREVEGRRKDGGSIPMEMSLSIVRFAGRTVYSAILRDITARKRAEADLIGTGRILENSLNEIYIFDSETLRFIQVNNGARQNLGYTMSELKGMTPLDFTPYSREEFERLVEPLRAKRDDLIIFFTSLTRNDGTQYAVEVHLQLADYRGKQAFVAIVLDITDRKHAEEEREKLIAELTAVNAELEQFAYIASHDLQEPLRMVTNFADLLSKRYQEKLDERAGEYLRIITDSARRMQELISDLLEYARSGQEAERFTRVDCGVELRHVLENLQQIIAACYGEVTWDPLPIITGNPVHFMRLMQNLIGNGLKYQPEGRRPRVHVGIEEKPGEWLFSVKDNGIGIKKEYLEKIFMPFKRLHTKQHYRGTGIGLAICRKIVTSHGGRIWAESDPGEGTVFYFTIPKIKA